MTQPSDLFAEPAHLQARHDAEHELAAPDAARFIYAGDAIFTVLAIGSGKRYTYRISECPPNPSYPNSKPAWFVKVLRGRDNTKDYAYLGMIRQSEPTVVYTTAKSSLAFANGPAHRGLEWLLRRLHSGMDFSTQARIFHAGRCGRCGRVLTTPESVTRGIGPDCADQMGIA